MYHACFLHTHTHTHTTNHASYPLWIGWLNGRCPLSPALPGTELVQLLKVLCVCVWKSVCVCVCPGRGEDRAPHCLLRQGCSPAGLTGHLCTPHIWTPPQQATHCALPYEIKRTFITGSLILLCPRSPSISRPKSHPRGIREDHTIICAIQSGKKPTHTNTLTCTLVHVQLFFLHMPAKERLTTTRLFKWLLLSFEDNPVSCCWEFHFYNAA